MRIGFGYDVHKLEKGLKLILGGVEIAFEKGLKGHSDADVLIHAIIDAILGSLALGDIGILFPDNDNKYKNIDSRILLKKTNKIIQEKGYRIENLDTTICAQRPKLKKYIKKMRENIAQELETDISNVSVKATTEEKMGISGNEKGITAYAIILLNKRG